MLSDRQKRIIKFATTPDTTHMLSVGAVRSGKTYSSIIGFFLYIMSLKKPYTHMILARRLRIIEVELLPLLKELSRECKQTFHYTRQSGVCRIGQQLCIVAAGNDEQSASLVQGATVHSALADEVTLFPETFFNMILSRLSYDDSKIWMTCNPSSPYNFIKRKFIDEGRFEQVENFLFDDNPTLGKSTQERLYNSFTGTFKERMVLGKWCDTEGLIYANKTVDDPDTGNMRLLNRVVGMDYGITSPSAFVVISKYMQYNKQPLYVIERSEEMVPINNIQPTDEEISQAAVDICREAEVRKLYVDPSAHSRFKRMLMAKDPKVRVINANNDVLPGIRITQNLLENNEMVIRPQCSRLIEEISNYSWVDRPGVDKPIKEDDHHCDAMRYAVQAIADTRNGPQTLPRSMQNA